MKCIICGKPVKGKKFFPAVHEGKCAQVRAIVCTSVDDSKYGIKGASLEVLGFALEYEKHRQRRKGIIQGIERRMRKIKKEQPRKCRACGCTDDKACPGGCYWVEDDLCSQCKPHAEITKAFESPLSKGNFTKIQIEKAKFICKDVLKHTASEEQIKDMYGFIVYCRSNSDKIKNRFPGGDIENYISFNITHDIYEFFKNSTEDWFSPRTSGYRKYLNP